MKTNICEMFGFEKKYRNMTGDDLKRWEVVMGLDTYKAHAVLGISRKTYFNLMNRDQVDLRTQYACQWLAQKKGVQWKPDRDDGD